MLALAATGALVLPIASAGCGRSACIVYSKGEYDVGATCPLQKQALPYFSDSTCPGPVVSIDGEGVFTLNEENEDQSLCCYPVTQQVVEFDDQRVDCIPAGTGGFGGVGGQFSAGTSTGGGSFPGCFTCGQAFSAMFDADPDLLCPESVSAYFDLQSCTCAGGSECVSVCSLNFCQSAPVSDECVSCVSSSSSCSDLLNTCSFN